MASERVSENTGDISTKRASMYIEWKVPHILLLSQDTRHSIQSPSFQLKDETFYIHLTIYDIRFRASCGMYGPVYLCLCRQKCTTLTQQINFLIGVKKSSVGNSPLSFSDLDFKKYGNITTGRYLMSRLDLSHEKNSVAPNGVVTFFCSISTEEIKSLYVNLGTNLSDDSEESEVEWSESEECSQEKYFKGVDLKHELQKRAGSEKLGIDFKDLFVSGEDSDVTIRVKNREFKTHKCILRARSPVFYSMFTHDMAEKNSGTVDIADCDPDAFEIFLLYLYSGNMENLSINTVFDLYKAADKYDAEELKLKCKEFILSSLSVDIICDVIEHALQHNEIELLKTATDFFAKNFKRVILTVNWQSFFKNNFVAANELLVKASNYFVLKE